MRIEAPAERYSSPIPFVLPLADERATLPVVGGKGASLARLVAAGLPAPPGFHVTTAAYAAFVSEAGLQTVILGALAGADPARPETLDAASAAIGEAFRSAALPAGLEAAVRQAYLDLPEEGSPAGPAVAVRSSATAEDLPELSFAGQHDTYLNVIGPAALLRALVDCWASLWTARAIGYRARNAVAEADIALAVVVQVMVQSEVSGVLFTADPLTGRRNRIVIDATLGLGEALVSGRVEPDHYAFDPAAGVILERRLGSKAVSVRAQAGGGTATVMEAAAVRQALPDAQIGELAGLVQRIAVLYGSPQDIEWAWAGGRFFILQSRPITSLFPLPGPMSDRVPTGPLQVWLSFAAVQGVLDPLTPAGQGGITALIAAGGRMLGYGTTPANQTAFVEAAERFFINLTPFVRNAATRPIVRGLPSVIDPASEQAILALLEEPALGPVARRISARTLRHLLPAFLPLAGRFLFSLVWPDTMRTRAFSRADELAGRFGAEMRAAQGSAARLAVMERMLAVVPPTLLSHVIPCFAPSMAMLNLLFRLARSVDGGRETVLEITRGLPHNVTTEMDLALWAVAQQIRADPASRACFDAAGAGPTGATAAAMGAAAVGASAPDLSRAYLAGTLPEVAQQALAGFLERYGMHGVAEIDLGRTRWRNDPTPLIQSLQSYLTIEDPEAAPYRVFARGALTARAAIERLAAQVRHTSGGRRRALLVRFAASRLRALGGMREFPKFVAVRMLGLAHEALLASGRELAGQGALERPEDIFFLRLDELRAAEKDGHATGGWRPLIAARRAVYERERRRTRLPRVLLSDGRAFYEGVRAAPGAAAGTLAGSPVSPGVAEGLVRIVLDPHGTQLAPGEILVCPGTDPAWTPLFLSAGALVMEVGGLMTHGAVVAREYGIPAVVGVHEATTRLRTGQRVRVDGTSGMIVVLDEGSSHNAAHGLDR
jgi:rifampicin phosphotransferase